MRIDSISLFPSLFEDALQASVIGRAVDTSIVKVKHWQLRDFGIGSYAKVDDKPYGGGQGMLLMAQPLAEAIKAAKTSQISEGYTPHVVAMSPSGLTFNQQKAREWSAKDSLIFVCGRYEGFDQRILDFFVDEVVSAGSFVVSGGELPACLMIDSVVRLLPGTLGNEASSLDDSFGEDGSLEYAQYTRPAEFEGYKVPEVLLEGHHAKIDTWRQSQRRSTHTFTK